jgi:CMP-N,N'-diacetyllegionaminic acid synthase
MPTDMKVVALQTARAGSKSIPKKNLLEIDGHPLFAHSINAATSSNIIQHVYCSTDDTTIMDFSKHYNFNVIKRPPELCLDNCSHLEAIRHGVNEIEKDLGKQDIVVLLLGNVTGIDSSALDEAIEMLGNNDSVVSVSEMNMYNPFRAHKIVDGLLATWIPQDLIRSDTKVNDKNSAGNIYYCNGNFWVMRRNVLFNHDNNLPFEWLGKKIVPYIQNVFQELDAPWQLDYVEQSINTFKGRIK